MVTGEGGTTPSAVVVAEAVSGSETRKTTLSDAVPSQTGGGEENGAFGIDNMALVRAVGVYLVAALLLAGLM